jgi:putative hydrolase of HD superfamily
MPTANSNTHTAGVPADTPPSDAELAALSRFIHEMGHLKLTRRTGWWLAGVKDPETVAEHIFRTAIVGALLAEVSGADPARTALLCLFHDAAESRVGDIPSVGKPYLRKTPDEEVTEDQVQSLPARAAGLVLDAVREYEERLSLEARLARDADKLECLAQALEYQQTGHPQAEHWVEGSISSIGSDIGLEIARHMRESPANEWWHSFVAAYRTQPAVDTDTHNG